MEKRVLKLLSCLLAFCLMFSAVPWAGFTAIDLPKFGYAGIFSVASRAADVVEIGTCGDDLTWTLDSDGKLTVSGTGEMEYNPWQEINTQIRSVEIKNGVTSIGVTAFSGCTGLTSITIPDSVISIGSAAFSGCTGLTSITIPDSVISIEYYAFFGCTGLTSITIPDSVTSIEYCAFSGCTGLTNITIPDSVTSIERGAFDSCTGLTDLTVSPNNPVYFSAGNCVIEKESRSLIFGCKNSVIPSDGSVTNIGDFAFYGCTGLTSITIPSSVTSIGDWAFSGCTGLTNITIPDSVTNIGYRAFYFSSGLTSITIPNSVTYIGYEAFSGCTGLTSITIPSSVTSIEGYAFSGCTGLTSITIPNSVTYIGDRAFSGCTGLTDIIIPPGVDAIGGDAVPDHTVIYGILGSYAQTWAAKNGHAFLPIGEAAVTLSAQTTVNTATVKAAGFANPGADVALTVNNKAAATVKAAANGRWTAEIVLPGAKDGDVFTLKAAVTLNGKTAEKTLTVAYRPAAILPVSFRMAHSCYTAEILGGIQTAARNFTVIPGKAFSFRVQVSNNDRVRSLAVISTKNKERKNLSLTYDANSGSWLGAGFFDPADPNYVPGVLTVEGTDINGAAFSAGGEMRFTFLVDPSGYAYEAVKSNVLSGVTAAIYYEDTEGHILLWNALPAEQQNPVETLEDGAFAWVVPEGKWQVRLYKDGYEDAASEWMDVPPEHTNVYLPMVSRSAPAVQDVSVYADHALISFDSYMKIDSVTKKTVSMNGVEGVITPVDKTETEAGSGVFYAKIFRFTPKVKFSGDVRVKISGAVNYADTKMAELYEKSFSVQSVPKKLSVSGHSTVLCGQSAALTVSAENAAGKTVTVRADGAILSCDAYVLTLDQAGKASLTVTALMPGTETLTFALTGTTLQTSSEIIVPVSSENGFILGDVDGNGKIEAADARLALRQAVGLETYAAGSAQFLACDADKNGKVEAADARLILRAAVGLEKLSS